MGRTRADDRDCVVYRCNTKQYNGTASLLNVPKRQPFANDAATPACEAETGTRGAHLAHFSRTASFVISETQEITALYWMQWDDMNVQHAESTTKLYEL